MKATGATKAYRWGRVFLLAAEFIAVVLLVSGGCYSKQNYQVMTPQNADELFKRNIVVEGNVVQVRWRQRQSWLQNISQIMFFCWYDAGPPEGPLRYDVSIDVDKVLKGDTNMLRRLQVKNCRPLTDDETVVFSQVSNAFPDNIRVRIGFDRQHGNSLSGMIVVPIEGLAPTTRPQYQHISSPPGH